MKFNVGDLVTLLPSSLNSSDLDLAIVIKLKRHPLSQKPIIELLFPDGFNATYWPERLRLITRNNDPQTILQSKDR